MEELRAGVTPPAGEAGQPVATIAPRRRWLAGILCFLAFGLGQVYNGQGGKGVVFVVAGVAVSAAALALAVLAFSREMLMVALFLGVGFSVFVLGDAVVTAGRLGRSFPAGRAPRWHAYLLFIAFSWLMGGLARAGMHSFFGNYQVPAASMAPTVLIGDRFLTDKTVPATALRRGDIVVFAYPRDPKRRYFRRIVAVGGDTVEIREGRFLLNAIEQPKLNLPPTGMIPPREIYTCVPAAVPAGSFFVLGDNLLNSQDSRQFGCVPAANIKGRVVGIYWSWDRNARRVRWERIGTKLH
jgi:signal peptidase I